MPDALELITPYQEAGEKEVKLPAPAYSKELPYPTST